MFCKHESEPTIEHLDSTDLSCGEADYSFKNFSLFLEDKKIALSCLDNIDLMDSAPFEESECSESKKYNSNILLISARTMNSFEEKLKNKVKNIARFYDNDYVK